MSSKTSRFMGLTLTLGLTGMGLFFLAFVMIEGRNINGPIPVFSILIAGGVFAAMMFGPVGKSIARMLEGESSQLDDQIAMRVEDLEARLAELTMEQSRVAELEDRLDFAERLLAQPPEVPRKEVDRGS